MNTSTFPTDVRYRDSLLFTEAPFSPSKTALPSGPSAKPMTEEINQWLANAQKMVAGCGALEPEAARRLELLTMFLQSEDATVAFGGHFKSGKSTLLNALLGRPILPTSGLPETGAMCVMRSGPHDTAHLCDATGRRALECTMEAIRHEISLTSSSGARRTQTHDVERLELELSNTPIGPRVRWIDSPGINDTAEMTECAQRAAAEADVLLWVLNTRQFLSIAEVDFLGDRIARCGPQSVALVVNAFLMSEESAEWDEFLTEQMPVHGEKLRERALDIGFDTGAPPVIVVVAGRALGLQNGDWEEQFGGRPLLRLMGSLSGSQQPRVQRARWGRALAELYDLTGILEEHLQSDLEALQGLRTSARAHQKSLVETARTNLAAFKPAVESAIDAFQVDWETRAYNCGESIANSIIPPHIWRDDTYAKYLNAGLIAANTQARAALSATLSALAQKHAQLPPDAACLSALQQLLSSPPVAVVVPNTPAPISVDSIIDSLGLRGQGAISASASAAKAKADAEGTQSIIRQVTAYAATSLRAHREQAIQLVLQHCIGIGDHLPYAVAPAGFSGGELIQSVEVIDVGAADEPAMPALYTSVRRGVFTARASNLRPNGPCLVRLHFADTASAIGERRFHVSVNGKRTLSDYDIFARAGGARTAVVEEFAARADASGNVSLHFEAGESGQPQVCAVQVVPQDEVKSRLSQIKVRVGRRQELLRDLLLLRQDAEKLARLF